ncbi:MAG: hypothetical protein AMXMBFR13_13920 [Phycisphaerae bacterium]
MLPGMTDEQCHPRVGAGRGWQPGNRLMGFGWLPRPCRLESAMTQNGPSDNGRVPNGARARFGRL